MAVNKIIGYQVRDNYGHSIGKVICFLSNAKGNVKKIMVKKTDGTITEFEEDVFDIKPTEIVIYDQLILKARTLARELILSQRRLEALEKLKNEERITGIVFEELKREFISAMESVKKERDVLLEELKHKNLEMAKQIVYLQKLMATLDVQYMIGEIGEPEYKMAVSEIKSTVERLNEEKAELDKEFDLLNLKVIQKEVKPTEPKSQPQPELTNKVLTVIPGKSISTFDERPVVRLP
ncbi:MAG: CdvA-like protein [Thermoproteota archaeon]